MKIHTVLFIFLVVELFDTDLSPVLERRFNGG